MSDDQVPVAIDLHPGELLLQWAEGVSALPAVELRSACRCGACRAAPGRPARVTDPEVRLADALPVGPNALQLVFSDGHDRGIYPWPLLREMSAGRYRSAL